MMSRETPFERLGRELETAAARQAATAEAPRRRRGWPGRTLAVTILAVVGGAGAAAWAATSLLSSGSPVPLQGGAPIAGRAQGAPIPGTVKLLTDDVADPDGGPPWGLRYWETDRKYACVQVGRVYHGKLGQITTGNVFHELRLGVTRDALGGCYALDGSGHAFTAIHTDTRTGAQPQPCLTAFRITKLTGPRGRVVPCAPAKRTVDFGLLGPNAKRFTYRVAGRDHATPPVGGVGAYLVVQRRVKPVIRQYGFHHRNPKLNVRGPAEPYIALTPSAQVITRVVYTRGTCVVRIAMSPYGACYAKAGFVPIAQPKPRDVRAAIRAFPAPNRAAIRVRFRARQAVIDGRSGYDIEIRPAASRNFVTQAVDRNVDAGDLVHTTVGLVDHKHGTYRIIVRYRTIGTRPGPYASLHYPGLLVGHTRVHVP
jgi:hypothetical protein